MRSVLAANAVLLPTFRQDTPDTAQFSIAVTAAAAKQAPPGFVIDSPDRPVGGLAYRLQSIVSRRSSLCHHSPLSSSAVRTRVWTPSGSVRSPRARSLFVVLRPTPRMPNAFNTVMGCTATSLSHAACERPGCPRKAFALIGVPDFIAILQLRTRSANCNARCIRDSMKWAGRAVIVALSGQSLQQRCYPRPPALPLRAGLVPTSEAFHGGCCPAQGRHLSVRICRAEYYRCNSPRIVRASCFPRRSARGA